MKANTKPANPIDLSTCQIGQKLKLRSGDEVKLIEKSEHVIFGFVTQFESGWKIIHRVDGRTDPKYKTLNDIIDILPLTKPKKPLSTPAAPKMSKKEILKAITYFRGILQALEDQIKP